MIEEQFLTIHKERYNKGKMRLPIVVLSSIVAGMMLSCGGTNDELAASSWCPNMDAGADSRQQDSGTRDTNVADTKVVDSFVADTSVVDSSIIDSTIIDTGTVADSGSYVWDDAAIPVPPNPPWWQPTSAEPLGFHWYLSEPLNFPSDVDTTVSGLIYDIDWSSNNATTVSDLLSLGDHPVCYVDIGTAESWRPDFSKFPANLQGNSVGGFGGEKWLDIRAQDILLPIQFARFQVCAQQKYQAVEIDNLDGWQNNPGFPLTEAECISYDLANAAMVHSLGMAVIQKNIPENAAQVQPYFDFALDEQCYQYSECSYFSVYTANNKAVFDVEYTPKAPNCSNAASLFINAQERDLNLNTPTSSGYFYSPCLVDGTTAW